MINLLHRYINLFLLIVFSLLLITACNSHVIEKTNVQKTQLAIPNCRIIKHKLGESCVPINPQRLVVTDQDTLDAVLALGLKPIAAAEPNIAGSRGKQFEGKIEGIISIGKSAQVNIERMVQLHPDLIMGLLINSQDYKLFSQIAPTVKVNFTQVMNDTWKYNLREIGEILGKNKQAQDILAQYEQRVKQLQKVVEQKLGKREVSVSRFYAAGTNTQFDTIHSFSGAILQSVGLSAPLHQLQLTTKPNITEIQISLEHVDLLDADTLFVALDPGAEENFRSYQKSQLWQSLNVAKNNQIYTVDSGYWAFGNFLAANAILDDISKYLLGAKLSNQY
ncbi:MAG: iron-siderophore ABC transporter substrate-binding protein [Calothrix sp. FI2-JRJ7]|jgi:iron complex transport system substrate-binding protein|nr:iron-siderophore ABC transporter substrate-binding protein [Calothrix sp. FI2-JRJ7]